MTAPAPVAGSDRLELQRGQATLFSAAAVRFAPTDADASEPADGEDSEEQGEPENGNVRKFSGIAATGQPFRHDVWGLFALDLESLELPQGQIPLLRDHGAPIGFADRVEVTDEGLSVGGAILTVTDLARETVEMADAGLQWQMSVWVPPGTVEFVDDGVELTVNGHRFVGPGHIFRNAEVREATVTALGADRMTSVDMLSAGAGTTPARFSRNTQMSDQNEPTPAAQTPAAPSDGAQRASAIFRAGTQHGVPNEMLQAALDGTDSVEVVSARFEAFAAGVAQGAAAAPAPAPQAPPSNFGPAGTLERLGAVPPASGSDSTPPSPPATPTYREGEQFGADQIAAIFAADSGLQAEFGDVETFQAYHNNRHRVTSTARHMVGADVAGS